MNVSEGLCNGTKLQVLDPNPKVLRCVILNGDKKGEITFIPRITLIEETEFTIPIKRHQFPVKVAFASTINKSQAQTLKMVGIDFEQGESFAHGQTYVGFARVSSWKGVKVKNKCSNMVKNIVWPEVLGR